MSGINLITPTFKTAWKTMSIRYSKVAEFYANPDQYLNPNTLDEIKIREWMDINTPGYTYEIINKGIKPIDIPVGADPTGEFVEFSILAVFKTVEYRDAFKAYLDAYVKAELERSEFIRGIIASAPEDAVICHQCGQQMVPAIEVEVQRLAQFAFNMRIPIHHCDTCRITRFSGDDTENMMNALSEINRRVGLPEYGSPLWTEAIRQERWRRRAAPPEVEIEVDNKMTTEEIIAKLDKALVKLGRPKRGGGLKLVE